MSDDGSIVTKEKVEKYLALTAEARAKATPIAASEEDVARLDSMMRMCDDYQSDAKHFLEQGDLVRAFGAINCPCLDRCCCENWLDGWAW